MLYQENQIFISFAEADRSWVKGYLLPLLSGTAFKLTTPDDFRPGFSKISELERAITSSRYTLLILSHSFLLNEWSSVTELLASHFNIDNNNNSIIPLKVKDISLPLRINFRIHLDFSSEENWASESARLLNFLGSFQTNKGEKVICPYPGMIPFTQETAENFYGREEEIDQVLNTMRHQRILGIIGASGSGKSSLVFGGVLPALKKSTFFEEGYWEVKDMRPGTRPVQRFRQLFNTEELDFISKPLQFNTGTSQKLLLIIDQFEELFSIADKQEATDFLNMLQDLKSSDKCFIILTMRAAFYQDLMVSPLWPLHPNEKIELVSLTGAPLAKAIVTPSRNVGVYFEPGLIESILHDAASEPGVLPLLQELMIVLWEKKVNHLITLRSYQLLGNNGLGAAISMKADNTFYALLPDQQEIAKRIFIRLIQFGEGRPDTRRQQPRSALLNADDDPTAFDTCLDVLVNNRLLTFDGEEISSECNIDISHESLIGSWTTLAAWITEKRESEQVRRRLQQKADEWVRLGKAEGGLLDVIEMAESVSWLKKLQADDIGYSTKILDLINSSDAFHKRIAAEKVKEQQSFNKKLKVRAWILSGALLLVIIAGLIVVRQLVLSKSRQLAAEALNSREQISNALQLSIDAYKTNDNDETKSSLLAMMQRSDQFYKILKGNFGLAWQVKISPDGKTAATVHSGGNIYLWDVLTGERKATLGTGQGRQLYTLTFFANGDKLAVGGAAGMVVIWDMTTLTAVDTILNLQRNVIFSLAVSPDNKYLAAGTDSFLFIIELTGKKLVHKFKSDAGYIRSLAFSPTAPILASGAEERTILLWDLNLMRKISAPLVENGGAIFALAFSPDGSYFVAGSGGGANRNLIVYDVASQQGIGFPLIGHTSDIMDLLFTHTGDTLFTCSVDNNIIAWDMNTFASIHTFRGHWAQVNSIALNKNGDKLLSAGWDGNLIIWNISQKELLCDSNFHQDYPVKMLHIFDDNKKLLTADDNGNIYKYENGTQALLSSQQSLNPTHYPQSLAYDKTKKWLFAGSSDGTIICWDITTEKSIFRLPKMHKDGVTNLAVFENGQMLASGGADGRVYIWDINSRRQWGRCLQGRRGEISDVSFSNDGRQIAVAYSAGSVIIWDLMTATPAFPPLCPSGYVISAQFSPDNKYVAIGSSINFKGKVQYFDLQKKKLLEVLPFDLESFLSEVRFTPDNNRLISAGSDGLVLFDIKGNKVIKKQPLPEGMRRALYVAPNPGSTIIATGYNGGKITILFLGTGQTREITTENRIDDLVFISDSAFAAIASDESVSIYNCYYPETDIRLKEKTASYINSADFYPAQQQIVSAGSDGLLRINFLNDKKRNQTVRGSTESILSVCFNPQRKSIVFAGEGSTIHVRDIHDANEKLKDIHLNDKVSSLAVSNDGSLFAAGTAHGAVYLFSFQTFTQIGQIMHGHTSRVSALSFSKDDKLVASGSYDRLIYLWNTSNQLAKGLPFQGHDAEITSIQFSPDNKIFASADEGGNIFLWSIEKHSKFGAPFLNGEAINVIKFSKNGKYLFSGDDDGHIKRWNLNPGFWVQQAEKIQTQ